LLELEPISLPRLALFSWSAASTISALLHIDSGLAERSARHRIRATILEQDPRLLRNHLHPGLGLEFRGVTLPDDVSASRQDESENQGDEVESFPDLIVNQPAC
jgi:hypothetical protein